MKLHILLVGLPGAGKTTVGRLVAEQLGAGFVDTDNMIVRKMLMPITRVFGEFGETKFRELERETMNTALAGPVSIIAPGGGWAAQPGQLEAGRENCFVIYLKALASTAASRASGEGTRPLLVGEDPIEKMRRLSQEREPYYLLADATVKVDLKSAEQVAAEIVTLARERAGW
ncbi:MAG: shikimate kinase [Gemmatimonadales bacterium]